METKPFLIIALILTLLTSTTAVYTRFATQRIKSANGTKKIIPIVETTITSAITNGA